MAELPPDLLTVLPDGAGPVAARWWASLPAADRERIAGLWDARLEVSFFAPQADDAGCVDGWEQVPAVAGGRFVPSDDDGRREWSPGYFEHLLQHPELVLAYEPPTRTFHIGCTRHAAARACLAAGRVPADFACPVGAAACPLVPLRGCSLATPQTSGATAVFTQPCEAGTRDPLPDKPDSGARSAVLALHRRPGSPCRAEPHDAR